MTTQTSLRRKQLDRVLPELARVRHPTPRGGWIRAIRTSLGMTLQQLADRMGLAKPTVSALESREAKKRITLHSIERAADALGCDLVYYLAPREGTLQATVELHAVELARRIVSETTHTMDLELQRPQDAAQQDAIAATAETLMLSRRLWDVE